MSVTETLVAGNELRASSFFNKGNLPMAGGTRSLCWHAWTRTSNVHKILTRH